MSLKIESMLRMEPWTCKNCGAYVAANVQHGKPDGCHNPYPLYEPQSGDTEPFVTVLRPHRIGVWDYDSLVECLKSNYEQAFSGETMRDPQDAIQRMVAEVMNLRQTMTKARDGFLQVFERALRNPPEGINPAWIEDNGFRAYAVETLRKVLEGK